MFGFCEALGALLEIGRYHRALQFSYKKSIFIQHYRKKNLIQQTLVRDSYAARTLYYFFERFNNLKFVEFMRATIFIKCLYPTPFKNDTIFLR